MKTIHPNSRALRLAVASVIVAGCCAFGVNSHADTDNANLAVTASISTHCAISTVPVASGSVTTTCTDSSTVAVTLGQKADADFDSSPAVYSSMPDSQNQPAGAVIATVMY